MKILRKKVFTLIDLLVLIASIPMNNLAGLF